MISPCVDICEIGLNGRCTGCFRTCEQIEHWLEYSDTQRQEIIDENEMAQWEQGLK